ncbi:nuclear transport factor 2 family protein [Sphingobium aromaticiconvertens]|uniref:nuclear transport factor 2 family protein n=1 Tax=Sphingobium aromaticiconvertens TaxID=365341 RepID=UPI003018B82A
MTPDQPLLETLVAKDQIRDLVLLYSRGVDRQDMDLLGTLYASDATDTHGDRFDGSASDYIAFLAAGLPHLHYSGHHVCNHLISVDGDTGEGEVYVLAYHIYPDGKGGLIEDLKGVRYIDRYRKEGGRWLFASRVVSFDFETIRPASPMGATTPPGEDVSYGALASRLFARGACA